MRRTATVDSKLVLGVRIVVGIIFLSVVWSLSRSLVGLSTLDKRLIDAQTEIDILNQENQSLQVAAEQMQSGVADEANIRNKLGLTKPGEELIIIPGNEYEKIQSLVDSSPVVAVTDEPVWKLWVKVFF